MYGIGNRCRIACSSPFHFILVVPMRCLIPPPPLAVRLFFKTIPYTPLCLFFEFINQAVAQITASQARCTSNSLFKVSSKVIIPCCRLNDKKSHSSCHFGRPGTILLMHEVVFIFPGINFSAYCTDSRMEGLPSQPSRKSYTQCDQSRAGYPDLEKRMCVWCFLQPITATIL